MATQNIVFVHGLFLTAHSWQPWVNYFQNKGYNAIAIPWPGREGSVASLRKAHPDPALGARTFEEVIEHHFRVIRGLDEPPLIIGHSLGVLITQLLLHKGLGTAGIAIDSGPPQGVVTLKWSFIKSLWPLLNPLVPASRPHFMSFPEFQYAFVNGISLEAQRKAYDEEVVPESVRLARGSLTSIARIDFKKPHPPLLMLAGENDHIIPASLNKSNFGRYKASPSVTDFKQFVGRNHYGVGDDKWTEMVDYILGWVAKQKV